MSDLSITAASVLAGASVRTERGSLGATITAGQVVYLDEASTGKWLLADNNAASAATRGAGKIGVALNGGASGQPVLVLLEGSYTVGATMTAGVVYYLSDTAGGICPVADLASGEYPVPLGVATSTTVLNFKPSYSGVAL